MDEPSPPTLPPGIPFHIDRYAVTAYLGRGAFGHGLKVKDPESERSLFLKWLRADAPVHAAERIGNEIWAMRQISGNRAFVSFVAEGIFEDRRYYVSTLATGETLRKHQADHTTQHGLPLGPKFVCAVTEQLLTALRYLSSLNLFHRDLKDDNITATPSGNDISIIDFGSCKASRAPFNDLTWQNPGATRFSPPSRDAAPSSVHTTHDLYSVGVLLYFLLTDKFPYEVEQAEGPSALTEKKKAFRHTKAWQVNGYVPQSLSEFIDKLITPEDAERPTVEDALARLREERRVLDRKATRSAIRSKSRVILSEVVRDPLHGDIRLTDTEFKIIHTPEFIRLSKLKQLGFANIPFPGAEHTRYLHSLGCVFVTERILRSIEDITGEAISAEDRLVARAYALVHDVTHLPFGHTLEDELGIFRRHDKNRQRIERTLLNESTPLGGLLFTSEIDRVRDLFQRDLTVSRFAGFKELLESVVGADVLDYIDRDSFFCGLDHRIDTALFRRFRLRHSPTGDEGEGNFYTTYFGAQGVRLDAPFASETIFLNRFALYLKVYTHPRKICAGAMLGKAIWEHTNNGERLDAFEQELEQSGDSHVLALLSKSSRFENVKRLATMLDNQSLFHPVYRTPLMGKDELKHDSYTMKLERFGEKDWLTPSGRHDIEKKLSVSSRLPEARIIVYFPPTAPGYNKLRQWVESAEGKIVENMESHPTHRRVQERHLELWQAYVFCHPDVDEEGKQRLAQAAANFFGTENLLPTRLQQTFLLTNI